MTHKCWAKSLGDCGGGITREHPLSRCVYPDQEIVVSGFDFCKSESIKLHINSLTAKILCKNHNERLGKEVDQTGGHLFEVIRAFTKRRNQQAEFPNLSWQPIEYRIDVKKLERWFLKVMLGIGFGHNLVIGSEPIECGEVSPLLARIAFGLDDFPAGQGLYIAFRDKETFQLEDLFRYTTKAKGSNLLMGYFQTHGLRFYLNLEPTGGSIYQRIEDSCVFYRKVHFIESTQDLSSPFASTLSALIQRPNSFTQKLSIS